MNKNFYNNDNEEDREYDRVFPRDNQSGRSTDARRRIERLLELRRLKEMDEEIYWDKLH